MADNSPAAHKRNGVLGTAAEENQITGKPDFSQGLLSVTPTFISDGGKANGADVAVIKVEVAVGGGEELPGMKVRLILEKFPSLVFTSGEGRWEEPLGSLTCNHYNKHTFIRCCCSESFENEPPSPPTPPPPRPVKSM